MKHDLLKRYLERPELERLWMLVRERLEALGGVRGTVRLEAASEAERAAVADLLGLATLPGANPRLALARLDRALRASRFGVGLEAAMSLVGGPLRDLPAERAEAAERRRRLLEEARAHPLLAERPGLGAWLDELEAGGLLRRLGGAREAELPATALAVLESLPAEGRPLAVVANEALGESHGLDAGRPVATLVLKALATEAGGPLPATAAGRRALWERSGVVCDELASHVLVLGLAPRGGGLLGEWLRAFAAAGEPVRITLRQLVGVGLEAAGEVVHVCENPAVVAAAADRLGAACRPLVCAEGYPSAAVLSLLDHLASSGAELRYHGDFDWPGLRIANVLHRQLAVRPWRFAAADYRRAAEHLTESARLAGEPAEAAWDAELAPVMAAAGLAVEEEAVLGELLGDLDRRR